MAVFKVVLYSCEMWCLILGEQNLLQLLENKVLREISGPKKGGGSGQFKKLHI
jgi:hypothetical protein